MYHKLNQNRLLKLMLASLAVLMVFAFVLVLPYDEVQAANALGTFYGGRIITFVPGYPWTVGLTSGFCPPHMIIMSFGAPYRGLLALTVPPVVQKSWYNYYTPGNAVKGAYYPVPFVFPGPISCPDQPIIFVHSLGGTSAVPGF